MRTVLLAHCACGWPEGLPSESSFGDDAASSSTTGSASESSTTTSSSTTSSTSTSAVDESGDDDGGGFIMSPDGGSPNLECDIWENDCPRGEKCMPWANDGSGSWNATKCTPIARRPKAPGEPCTVVKNGVSGVDDCEAGSMCWDVAAETNMGECVAFCIGPAANPTCMNPGAWCAYLGDNTPFMLCLSDCDPLAQDCGDAQACYPTEGHFVCAWDGSEDAGEYGDPCEFVNVCDPGLFCANADMVLGCDEATGCCASFCDLSAPICPLFTACVAWYEDGQAAPGFENVGACLAEAP